jgi:ligand-binding sensor domain-containing protein
VTRRSKSGERLYRASAMLMLLLVLSLATWAQRLPMRLYTIEDGLGSGFINHTIRDSHGFLWFCTRDGLSRFDGYRFTNYEITGGPASQNFTQIFQSRKGIFWIMIDDKQLYRWDPESGTGNAQSKADQLNHEGRVSLPAQLVSSNFNGQMLEDHNGNLWAGGAGLWLIEERAGKVYFREINLNLPQNWKPAFRVWAITEGNDGSLWLGTTHGLLRRLPDGCVVQYHLSSSPSPENIRWLLADKRGFIWATYPEGVYVLRPEPLSALASAGAFTSFRLMARSQTLDDPLPRRAGEATDLTHLKAFDGQAKEITNIYQQSNGQIWLVVKNRVVSFDGQRFYWLEDARTGFGGMCEDLDGELWITTRFGGVVRLSARGLISYGQANGLGNDDIASIYEDSAGLLHVVSSGWRISRLEAGKFRSVHANIPDARGIWSSPLGLLDHTGQWWFLTSRGVFRFAHPGQFERLAHATPRVYKTLGGFPGQGAYSIFEDLWQRRLLRRAVPCSFVSRGPALRTYRRSFNCIAMARSFSTPEHPATTRVVSAGRCLMIIRSQLKSSVSPTATADPTPSSSSTVMDQSGNTPDPPAVAILVPAGSGLPTIPVRSNS